MRDALYDGRRFRTLNVIGIMSAVFVKFADSSKKVLSLYLGAPRFICVSGLRCDR